MHMVKCKITNLKVYVVTKYSKK